MTESNYHGICSLNDSIVFTRLIKKIRDRSAKFNDSLDIYSRQRNHQATSQNIPDDEDLQIRPPLRCSTGLEPSSSTSP